MTELGPGQPPRDERPSAECQMLRERLAAVSAFADHTYHCRVSYGGKCDCGYIALFEDSKTPPAVPLTRDCVPGQLVTWQNVLGWTFTGTLKEWDNGTAMIEWPMIQTPLVAVQAEG